VTMTVRAAPTVDAHSDLLMDVARRRLLGERRVLARRHLPALRAGGVTVQFLTVGGDFPMFAGDFGGIDYLRQSLEILDAIHCEHEEAPAEFCLVRSKVDVDMLAESDEQVGFVLHWEGMRPAESLSTLRLAWRLGLRSAGLSWGETSAAADGSGSDRDAGLTPYGRSVVEEMDRLGMVVDVSHMADRSVAEVCALSRGPVVASHTNARTVFDHPRNLPDSLLVEIARTGGAVGVCAYPVMLTLDRRPEIDDLVRHIDYLCELIGPRAVGIGGDFTADVAELWCASAHMHRYHHDMARDFPVGLESPGDLGNLRDALDRRGFDKADVAAIMGGNFLRVLMQRLPDIGVPQVVIAAKGAER